MRLGFFGREKGSSELSPPRRLASNCVLTHAIGNYEYSELTDGVNLLLNFRSIILLRIHSLITGPTAGCLKQRQTDGQKHNNQW